MILRAKTKNLFSGRELSERQQLNSKLNMEEMEQGRTILESYPRRLAILIASCVEGTRRILSRQYLTWMRSEALNRLWML